MPAQYLPDLNGIRRRRKPQKRLDATTASATRPTGPIMRDRSHIFNSANAKTVTCQHTDRGLSTGTRGPSFVASRRTDTNMERSDPLVLRDLSGSGRGLHRSIRGPLQTVRFDVLTSRAPRDCLSTRQVRDVDHCVIEAGIDVGDSPAIDLLSLLCH